MMFALGCLLLALPFIIGFILMVKADGVGPALTVFALTGLIAGTIMLGAWLVTK